MEKKKIKWREAYIFILNQFNQKQHQTGNKSSTEFDEKACKNALKDFDYCLFFYYNEIMLNIFSKYYNKQESISETTFSAAEIGLLKKVQSCLFQSFIVNLFNILTNNSNPNVSLASLFEPENADYFEKLQTGTLDIQNTLLFISIIKSFYFRCRFNNSFRYEDSERKVIEETFISAAENKDVLGNNDLRIDSFLLIPNYFSEIFHIQGLTNIKKEEEEGIFLERIKKAVK